ncbi:MAG: hypothetical protein WD557_19250 [Dehalococcoidia bacterium]
MKLRLEKPWNELTAENVRRLPGQLGVYQVARADGAIEHIGFAGARELFGLRSALERKLAAHASGSRFRVEVNTQYQSRWRELLMLHVMDHGALPPGNESDRPATLGRLS